MDPKAILFDLDMTLVDSSRLDGDRAAGFWQRALSRIDELRYFPATVGPPPDAIPGLLKDAGKSIAVVTSSPRDYAQAVLDRLGIRPDVLVAYHDTEAHKPDPEPLQLAMQQLGVAPSDCIYVGDDPIDAEAAYHAGVVSIGALWRYALPSDPRLKSFFMASPDIPIRHPGMLLMPGRLADCRFVGEAVISGLTFHPHDGCRHYWREPGGETVECLGRYFVAADVRSASARWTNQVLHLKEHPEAGDVFARAIAEFLKYSKYKPDAVVQIPPKPGLPSRFSRILEILPSLLSEGCVVVTDGLNCDRAVDGYKTMEHLAREAAIRGTISTRYNWTGRRILLLDDVVTSGSTTRECARILRASGAADVRVLGLSLTQDYFTGKTCVCQRPMKVRNGPYGKFWGCSGYPHYCQRTQNLVPGELTS